MLTLTLMLTLNLNLTLTLMWPDAGAQDIGSWQYIMNALSWLACIVNCLIFSFSNLSLRNVYIIPSLATDEGNETLCPRNNASMVCPTS